MSSADLDFLSDRDLGDENDSWPPHERVLSGPGVRPSIYFCSASAFREALGAYEEPDRVR